MLELGWLGKHVPQLILMFTFSLQFFEMVLVKLVTVQKSSRETPTFFSGACLLFSVTGSMVGKYNLLQNPSQVDRTSLYLIYCSVQIT